MLSNQRTHFYYYFSVSSVAVTLWIYLAFLTVVLSRAQMGVLPPDPIGDLMARVQLAPYF